MAHKYGNRTEKRTLPDAAKAHFSAMELPKEKLAALMTMPVQTKQSKSSVLRKLHDLFIQMRWNGQGRRLWSGAVMMTVACTVLVSLGVMTLWHRIDNPVQRLFSEVAYNHNKRMALEIESPDLGAINGYLSQLDFAVVQSGALNPEQWQLLGGRYCSIGGQLAAQLKVRNRESGQIYTFYQARLPEQIFRQAASPALEGYADGVKVRLWQERGLLMGLAGEGPP